MTGMLNSNPILGLTSLLFLAGLPNAMADKLSLSGDATLTGKVQSINENGIVELISEIATDPLLVKPDAIVRVAFDEPKSLAEPIGGMVELLNGDLLPAAIGGFDSKILKVTTMDIGSLDISRDSLKSMQLGVQSQKAIYAGPKSLEEWTKDSEGSKGWRFSAGALTTSGQASATRKIDVPSRFVFKFTLKWQASPNCTVYFADPLTPDALKVDRYLLQLGPQGIEIKRESSTGLKIQPIILPVRSADEFSSNQVDVEIRVDRKTSRIHLLLNGEPEASGIDPVANPPIGNGFSFVSKSYSSNTQQVQGIEIWNFDNSQERHRSEDRGDLKFDSIITREDSRCSGRLTGIRQTAVGSVLIFESDFQDKPLELLESDVSTVFFSRSEATPQISEKSGSWILRLRGGAVLHLTNCVFTRDRVKGNHPLLGELDIDRSGVTQLERLRPSSQEKSKK